MNFQDLKSSVNDLHLFNLNDIRKLDPEFHRQQLTDWQVRGYIRPLAGGYYILADLEVDEGLLFFAANRIYAPSYISLESALAFYQVIPETVLGVTSVSTRKTRRLESNWGMLTYRRIKPATYFGYEVWGGKDNQKILLARLEKAVLDYLYLNAHLQTGEDFEGLRWNREVLQSQLDFQLFEHYLAVYKVKSLAQRVQVMKDYLDA